MLKAHALARQSWNDARARRDSLRLPDVDARRARRDPPRFSLDRASRLPDDRASLRSIVRGQTYGPRPPNARRHSSATTPSASRQYGGGPYAGRRERKGSFASSQFNEIHEKIHRWGIRTHLEDDDEAVLPLIVRDDGCEGCGARWDWCDGCDARWGEGGGYNVRRDESCGCGGRGDGRGGPWDGREARWDGGDARLRQRRWAARKEEGEKSTADAIETDATDPFASDSEDTDSRSGSPTSSASRDGSDSPALSDCDRPSRRPWWKRVACCGGLLGRRMVRGLGFDVCDVG
ncbi:hypothetical protein HDZ31DRAFT_76949 [Schizophyllum fasciatum]